MTTLETPLPPTSQVLDAYDVLCETERAELTEDAAVRRRRETRMVMRLPKGVASGKGTD